MLASEGGSRVCLIPFHLPETFVRGRWANRLYVPALVSSESFEGICS